MKKKTFQMGELARLCRVDIDKCNFREKKSVSHGDRCEIEKN